MGKLSFSPSLQTPGGRRVRLGGGGLVHGVGATSWARHRVGTRGVEILHGRRGGWARGGVLPVPMATRPIAGPTVMHWSRPRQEVGQGRLSPTGSSRPA
jgi:hypothetical protein